VSELVSFIAAPLAVDRWWGIWGGCIIRLTSESSETLIVDIYAPRVKTCDQDVDSQIEFETINEKWIRDVTADYTRFINWYFTNIINLKKIVSSEELLTM